MACMHTRRHNSRAYDQHHHPGVDKPHKLVKITPWGVHLDPRPEQARHSALPVDQTGL